MRAITTTIVAIVILTIGGCHKESAPSVGQSQQHGAKQAMPGSHADWCGEHNVAESLCTRCNSSLIPAFQATGDWCPEHGLPESQCLICNPGLKFERPAKAGGK